jgi:hypothetical protein
MIPDGRAQKRFVIKVGGYQDVNWGVGRYPRKLRIEVKNIVMAKLPKQTVFENGELEQADIAVDAPVVYGGQNLTPIAVNEYLVPFTRGGEMLNALYFYKTSDHSLEFCRIIVDHIDARNGEVTLDAFFAYYFD